MLSIIFTSSYSIIFYHSSSIHKASYFTLFTLPFTYQLFGQLNHILLNSIPVPHTVRLPRIFLRCLCYTICVFIIMTHDIMVGMGSVLCTRTHVLEAYNKCVLLKSESTSHSSIKPESFKYITHGHASSPSSPHTHRNSPVRDR